MKWMEMIPGKRMADTAELKGVSPLSFICIMRLG